MAARVCDVTPCAAMQSAIDLLVTKDKNGTFNFLVLGSERTNKKFLLPQPYLVPIEYCPFCGTRIDERWDASGQLKRPMLQASKT